MSPEQAKGRPADMRSDIWAFGCVLYEMLTGKRAFGGDDVSDTLANVLKADPDWDALPPATPPRNPTLLRRCLMKDRRQRLQAIGDALREKDHQRRELRARCACSKTRRSASSLSAGLAAPAHGVARAPARGADRGAGRADGRW
jgi:serine/threonine protein kinase